VLVLFALLGLSGPSVAADKLQTLPNVHLIADRDNDGDSFLVHAGERRLLLRLYYADCPETNAGNETDARRLRAQRRYFGVKDEARMVHFGKQAWKLTEAQLAKPFTVHTAFATAPGRAKIPRVYSFVTTADGQDLGSLLVQHGLARAHGVRRETPERLPAKEMTERVRDMEAAAMLKRAGIWAEADPDRLAELRAEQRAEDRELQQIQREVGEARTSSGVRFGVSGFRGEGVGAAARREPRPPHGVRGWMILGRCSVRLRSSRLPCIHSSVSPTPASALAPVGRAGYHRRPCHQDRTRSTLPTWRTWRVWS